MRGVVGECGGEDCWAHALPPLTNMTAQLLCSYIILLFCLDPNNKSLLELFLTVPGRVVRGMVGGGEDCWARALPPLVCMTPQLLCSYIILLLC